MNLYNNKLLTEDILKQPHCGTCDRFLADRYVRGICPHCKYEKANGDQCESCGKLLDPAELINPKCEVCNQIPVIKETKHMFLDLPSIEPRLK